MSMKRKGRGRPRRDSGGRQKNTARFQLPKDADISYKNFTLLAKYINDRGRVIPRRISGVTAKEQRQLTTSIKRARHLGLLTSGGVKKK